MKFTAKQKWIIVLALENRVTHLKNNCLPVDFILDMIKETEDLLSQVLKIDPTPED